jgi:predicted alpha-1,2-mannosidase
MQKIFLLITLATLSLYTYGEGINLSYDKELTKPTESKKDLAYWQRMAEGMSRSLTTHFWGANFQGYPDRYYFNYGSDLSNMTTNHYWPQAHAMDVIVDAYIRTSNQYYLDFYPLWWQGAPKFNFSGRPEDRWWNVFVDDMDWIVLAQLRMFETTRDETYFTKAKQMYNDWIWTTWGPEDEAPWHGGITWKTDARKSKNACSNGPSAIIAARIYTMFDQAKDPGNKSKQAYLDEAIKIYTWLRDNLYNPADGKVSDNMNATGKISGAAYTYNQGTFIGAAHELYKITGNKQYLAEAVKAAGYVIDHMSNNDGVPGNATSGDGGLFNGIFFRYFVKLINDPDLGYAVREKFHRYITNCATVMAEQGVNPETMLYGGNWRKAPASGDPVALTPQLSGCMLMEAMCILKPLPQKQLTDYVNPFLGTATLWDSIDIGYRPTHRTWGAEVFPGSSVPNAMVQLSPVTKFRSGSGYQYEDTVIYGFIHTSKGHWNLCNIPLLPATGNFSPDDYSSRYSHKDESAHPGYYQVYLERYNVNAELTSTLRCAFHKYTFKSGQSKKLIADLAMANERIRSWKILQEGENIFTGFQQGGETMYFYAVANHKIMNIDSLKTDKKKISVINFADESKQLEIRIGFSFVSIKNAKENFEKEIEGKSFDQVRKEAVETWEALLSKIKVTGGTERQKGLFYSTLYRSFLWPALRSDVNGEFTDKTNKVVNKGFSYYTEPSLWDDYRNKLILLGMISPEVTADVIKSLIDKGEKTGFMPTFFHGDHAAPFIAGSYLRGIRDYDVKSAYNLLLRNATLENRSRPHILEYIEKGYISEPDLAKPVLQTVANAGVTKTLEYAYDDYAVALLAKELNDGANFKMLMKRTSNYKNMFDPSTGFMRGRLANGEWIKNFDPEFVYYEYMYREANAWQSSFFAPHDVNGLISLFKSKDDFEKKLDALFTTPFTGQEADNMSGFIGQYCQGNQPDHNYPYLYYWVNKQEKSQAILDSIMNHYYDMGKEKLAYPGMDDAGEMSSWYVFNAIGLYTFSPADPEYIISVPLFNKVEFNLGEKNFTIIKKNSGKKISSITYGGRKIKGYFISHEDLKKGKKLVITTR